MSETASSNSKKALSKRSKSIRNGKIDLLKFMFSLVVATYHFGNSVNYENECFSRGYYSVEFFFIVSGYLLAKSISKYDGREKIDVLKESLLFMKKKYFSLFPYHLFIFIITLALHIIYLNINFEEFIINTFCAIPDLLMLQMFNVHPLEMIGHEWYISAMLIVMFILTPVMIKYRKLFSKYIAPILALSTLAYLYHGHDNINIVREWSGFLNLGIARAFVGISIGCIAYSIAETGIIERMNRAVLILLEIISYFAIFYYMNSNYTRKLEFSLIYLLAFVIMISFSNKAGIKILNNKFVYFLGKLSLPIYLCHIGVRTCLLNFKWNYGYGLHLLTFLCSSIIAALICLFVVDGIKKLKANYRYRYSPPST